MKFTPEEIEATGVMRPLIKMAENKEIEDDLSMPSLEEKQVVLNQAAVKYAEHLIEFGRINRDDNIAFTEHERKAAFGADGKDWKSYAECHLGVDESKPEETRMRHVLPIVKAGEVYAKALVRACASDSRDVAEVAWGLCKKAGLIEENRVRRPQKADMTCPVMAMGRSCPMNAAGKCVHMGDAKGCDLQMDTACPLIADGAQACPMMKNGEGCPMDAWSGCAQLDADADCKLGARHCCMVKAEGEEE